MCKEKIVVYCSTYPCQPKVKKIGRFSLVGILQSFLNFCKCCSLDASI